MFSFLEEKLMQQAQKSPFALLRRIGNLNILVNFQDKLCDSLVSSIFLSFSEIWGNIN